MSIFPFLDIRTLHQALKRLFVDKKAFVLIKFSSKVACTSFYLTHPIYWMFCHICILCYGFVNRAPDVRLGSKKAAGKVAPQREKENATDLYLFVKLCILGN